MILPYQSDVASQERGASTATCDNVDDTDERDPQSHRGGELFSGASEVSKMEGIKSKRCRWVDFRLQTNNSITSKYSELPLEPDNIAIICDHSTGSDTRDCMQDGVDELKRQQTVLTQLRWLKLKNRFVHQVILKQKQPLAKQSDSTAIKNNKHRAYRWVTVTSAVTLMQEPGSDDNGDEAVGWHRIDLREYLNENFMTTTKIDHSQNNYLLEFRLFLRQPAPWPEVRITNLHCSLDSFTRDSESQDIATSHLSIRMSDALERASHAATRLVLQMGQLDLLNQRYKSTRWRYQAVNEAARKGGLAAVLELRSTPRYQQTLGVLYGDRSSSDNNNETADTY
jgi:hypothetical protein